MITKSGSGVAAGGAASAKAARSWSSCCTERSERISSIACPSKAWATVSIAALALSSTSAEVPGVMSPFTESSIEPSMPALVSFLANEEALLPSSVTCSCAWGAVA